MRDKLIRLILKGDTTAFHSLCNELEPEDYDLSQATFRALSLTGFDLSGFNLSDSEWENCNFSGVRLDMTNLSGSYLHGCAMVDVTVEAADMSGAAIENCVLRGCTFSQCDMSGSEVSDSQLHQFNLDGGDLTELDWQQLTFEHATLKNISDSTGQWRGVVMRSTTLESCDFDGLKVVRCRHQDSTLVDTVLPDGFKEGSGRRRTV